MASGPISTPLIVPIARWQSSLPSCPPVCSAASADGTLVAVGFADGKIWLLTRDETDDGTGQPAPISET
ncbi:hypothetical protein HDU93_000398, partial [Gonapodya sp. JEL0774]